MVMYKFVLGRFCRYVQIFTSFLAVPKYKFLVCCFCSYLQICTSFLAVPIKYKFLVRHFRSYVQICTWLFLYLNTNFYFVISCQCTSLSYVQICTFVVSVDTYKFLLRIYYVYIRVTVPAQSWALLQPLYNNVCSFYNFHFILPFLSSVSARLLLIFESAIHISDPWYCWEWYRTIGTRIVLYMLIDGPISLPVVISFSRPYFNKIGFQVLNIGPLIRV